MARTSPPPTLSALRIPRLCLLPSVALISCSPPRAAQDRSGRRTAGCTPPLQQPPPLPPVWNEHGNAPPVVQVALAELPDHPRLLLAREPDVGPDNDGEERHGQDRRPVDELAEERQEDRRVLRVPDHAIEAGGGQASGAARPVDLAPPLDQQGDPQEDEGVPDHHLDHGPEIAPPEERGPEVTALVEPGDVPAQEPAQNVHGEREPVHLGIEGDDEGLHQPRPAPLPPPLGGH